MDNEMEKIYTDVAKDRLKKYTQAYVDKIEKEILDRKWIPGETSIEITASDIDNVASQIQLVNRKKISFQYLVIYIYSILGLALVFYGIFYSQINIFFSSVNFFQIMLIYVGLFMLFVSVFMYMRLTPRKLGLKIIELMEKKP